MALKEQGKIIFDVETQRTFDEVGGPNKREALGVSFVGVYSYSQDKFFGFYERDLPKLEQILLGEQPLVIGFNSEHFDIPVLQPYFHNLDLKSLPQLDLLKEAEKVLGHRLKLDSIAQATLYESKSGNGLDAIRWFRQGDFESLAKYCLDDVRITRDIYEYGLRHGRLFYPNGGEKKSFVATWQAKPTVLQQLEEAFKRHLTLEIEYLEIDDGGGKKVSPTTVEILNLLGEKFEAFCHRRNAKRWFEVANVWNILETGETYAHQGRLF